MEARQFYVFQPPAGKQERLQSKGINMPAICCLFFHSHPPTAIKPPPPAFRLNYISLPSAAPQESKETKQNK